MIDFILGLSFRRPPEPDQFVDALAKGAAVGCVVGLLFEFYLWRVLSALRKQKKEEQERKERED